MITQTYYPTINKALFFYYPCEQRARDNADEYTVGMWKLKKLK